jgi:carbamoyltransferase
VKILGLNAFHGDASAALLINGELAAFAAEERFNRLKHCAGFPELAIQYCLREAGLRLEEIDAITVSKDPYANLISKALLALRHPGLLSPAFLKSRFGQGAAVTNVGGRITRTMDPGAAAPPLVHVEHHLAHAASAFFASPYERSAILTLDGMGDSVSAILAIGDGNRIHVLKRVRFPHSLGFLYTAVSQHLGFTHFGDEGKVMGLAALGKPTLVKELRQIIHPTANGLFQLNLDYFQHQKGGVSEVWDKQPAYGPLFSNRVQNLLGAAREPKTALLDHHKDLAASLQEMTEEIFFQVLNTLHRETGEQRLCFAGGVALNCVMNGKIQSTTPFKDVYIQADAGDGGTALGGALFHYYGKGRREPRLFRMEHPYWGPQFGGEAIEAALQAASLPVQKDPDICGRAAQAIADGKVIGWFQGRMEVGPRALGNRSILADPRRHDMKDILNARIKHRESFRPFAPSVLAENCAEWFEGPAASPFMLMNYLVRPEKRSRIPAVTHEDGTARVQTVEERVNPRYWRLIHEFEKRTGVPVVLNTSFNEDEPIVCTPADAIRCFQRTPMDMLAIGDYWVAR